MSKLAGFLDPTTDPQAVQDFIALAPDELDEETVAAALQGRRMVRQLHPANYWREGFTKANLITILGRKTKAQIENAIGVRSRTKRAIFEAIGTLTKDELAEILGFISPDTQEVEPRFDDLNPDTQWIADTAQGLDFGTQFQVRQAERGEYEHGPFPDLLTLIDTYAVLSQSNDYIYRYPAGYYLIRDAGAWYLKIKFWKNQSDRKRRGVRRSK